MELKVFVKNAKTREGKDFKIASYVNGKGEWYKVKFTQSSGVSLAKCKGNGFYDVIFDSDKVSVQKKRTVNETTGEAFIDKVIWIADENTTLTPHKETEDEKANRLNKVAEELA